MRRVSLKRSGRIVRQRTRGQSIPLIALMVVILFAMVGLSVDVGNTFAQERKAVAAGNAAAIAGMDAYIKGGNAPDDAAVKSAIENTLDANDIVRGDENDQIQYEATYLDSKGAPLVEVGTGTAPLDASFIQVKMNGRVNTFFARITGRNDLPLDSNAYAGRCPPTSGVYPIAVSRELLNSTGDYFVNPNETGGQPTYGEMGGLEYFGKTWRRIYIGGGSSGGKISFVRWNNNNAAGGIPASSEQALINSLSGDGNLDEGFEELPAWPTGAGAEPENYPDLPNRLGGGDWIYGAPENLGAITSLLNEHKANGTYMILPTYNEVLGTGSDAIYLVSTLYAFVIKDIGSDANGSWIELIALGDPSSQSTSCAATPPSQPRLYSLKVPVGIYPQTSLPPERKPIQYMVVLDVSGSMSSNFNGQCNNQGNVRQCEIGPPGSPPPDGILGTGTDHWWNPSSERRIAIAKDAMERLIELMNMPGNPSYNPAFPSDEMALVWFNQEQKTSMSKSWNSDPATLKASVRAAGATGGDQLRTNGGTNGAAGLYRGALLLKQRPATIRYNNQTWEYKRVVIFITDGVSKDFFKPSATNLSDGSSSATTYPTGSHCRNLGSKVATDAGCQTTEGGGEATGKWNNDRPISQMIKVSNDFIKNDTQVNAEIFVIALSNIPAIGLRDGVASFPSYYYSVPTLQRLPDGSTNVDLIMESIFDRSGRPTCEAQEDPLQWTVPQENAGATFGGRTLNYPEVGEAMIIHQQTGDVFTSKVIAGSGSNGENEAVFTNLQPGTYELSVYLIFRHGTDGVLRSYSGIYDGSSVNTSVVVTVPGENAGFDGTTQFPVEVKLTPGTDVCAPTQGG
jgi:hypothetical protein